ncbi:MAG TPA: AAA family ATPase, partial [Kofleriaceae bacterium]|nr:AAA family ATPase [Kofleriaceae bacterium]
MKILAIRGCNLASLAGEFEIDLAHGPLGGTGVFAIVGNTGAGKSTLLDALCVALFDRTPRLTNHSTVKVGRGLDDRALLGAQDVRTLLRRGAAQGWAEVDFESGDARQYRARWSVRRARGQSDGTLQDQQLSLTAIEGGERFGGTKTETLKAIHARLGLSFDQFRRSALLAQGEFAAFLRADGKDRSELLERMTGTQIYTRLSMAAHVKASLAEQRLRDGRAAALAIAVLDDEAVRAARIDLEGAAARAREARRRHAIAVEAARWIAEAARRARELAEAGADHAAARAAVTAAEADRAELALRRRAELLRPAWDAAARLDRGVASAAAEVAGAREAAERAAELLAAIAQRRARVAATHAPVRAARIAAGIVERTAGGPPAEPIAEIMVGATAGTPVLAGAGAGVGAGAAKLASDAAWLVARAALGPEVAAWPELDARFAQHAGLAEAIAALDRAITEQADTKLRLERERKAIAGDVRAATGKHDDAKRTAAGYAQKRGLTLDAARRLEDEARNRLGELERLVSLAVEAREAAQAHAELDGQLAALAAAVVDDAGQRTRLAEAERTAQVVRGEQATVVDGLRRAAGYEHARAELVEGEPCPLCGAEQHPWRDRGALDDVIAAAEVRLAATLAELDAIARQAAAIAARDDHRRHDQGRLVRQREALAASAVARVAAWRDRLGALGELLLVGDPAEPAASALAADRQALARKKLEEARMTRHQTEAATKAAQEAQGQVQLCQTAVDQLTRKLAEHDKRLAELDATLGRARGERTSKAEQHAGLERALAAALARWYAALPGDDDPDDADAAEGDAAVAVAVGAAPRRGRSRAAAGAVDPAGEAIRPAFVVALMARLQASAPVRRAQSGSPESPLAIVRVAMAAVVAVWRERAERIAQADAALAAGAAAIDREAREVDRAVAEHTARREAAAQRRDELGREQATAAAQLAAARTAAGFEPDE